jgi:hypothetical protein
MSKPLKNRNSIKRAMITSEQEELLRLFEQAKELGYGEFTISIWRGDIARYKIKKSKIFYPKSGAENIGEAAKW